MKNTKISFRLILAALAATVALTACTKEPAPGKVDTDPKAPQSEGSRIIAVSFGNATKTDFSITDDGIAPFFKDGDEIVLCSDTNNPTDENTQTCTVFFDENTKATTITTKLTGELTAYYPASLVSKSEKHGLFIYVPSVQDGTFANANICRATIAENATSANFENMYALFVITPPEGTKKLTIKSLRTIGEEGQRSVEDRPIICGTGDDSFKITVGDGTAVIPSPCYVALIHGVNLSDLSFEATSNVEGATGYIKGITTSAIAATAGTDVAVGSEAYNGRNAVAAGSAYTIDENNWHEYVTIAGRKWAVNNVGDYGDYYMWGTSVVAYEDHPSQRDDMIYFVAENPYGEIYQNEWKQDDGYCWNNTPFTKGVFLNGNDVFVKYTASVDTIAFTGSADGKIILDLEDDAAYANWGGAWRMPTSDELDAVKGDDNFWPAGALNGANRDAVDSEGSFGYYWSSTLDTEHPEKAKCLRKESGFQGNIEPQPRYWGCTVRAIIDEGTILPPSED